MESGSMEKKVEVEYILIQMVQSLRENGKVMIKMEMEHFTMLMGISI